MSDRWVVLAAVAVIGATTAVTVARAGSHAERFALLPNAPRVAATATISDGSLEVTVEGLRPHVHVDAAIERLACAQSGYARRPAGGAAADAEGRAVWTARPALTAAARDGRHVLALGARGTTIACGQIPGTRPAVSAPPPRWGFWAFARRSLD